MMQLAIILHSIPDLSQDISVTAAQLFWLLQVKTKSDQFYNSYSY